MFKRRKPTAICPCCHIDRASCFYDPQPVPGPWLPEHLDLQVDLARGEAWFPAIYAPMASLFGDGMPDTYSIAFPADCLLESEVVRRLGLGFDQFLVKGGVPWSGNRSTVTARSKARPEVSTLWTSLRQDLHGSSGLDYLARMAVEADARNISRDRLLADHALTIQLRATRGDLLSPRFRGSVRSDQYVLGLEKVYLRDPF